MSNDSALHLRSLVVASGSLGHHADIAWTGPSRLGAAVGKDHPSYENPTLLEAICEIQFAPSAPAAWAKSGPAAFFLKVKDSYPSFEALASPPANMIQFAVGAAGKPVPIPKITLGQPAALTKFVGADESSTCVVGPNLLRVHRAAPYRGWKAMSEEIRKLWDTVLEVAQPSEITRIGLRYINVVWLTEVSGTISDYLLPTKSIPENVVQGSLELPVSMRSEVWLGTNDVRLMTMAKVAGAQDGKAGLMLDIDRSSLNLSESDVRTEAVLQKLERNHQDIWEEFDAACGPSLRAHLGEPTNE